jgi:hypothetical protein
VPKKTYSRTTAIHREVFTNTCNLYDEQKLLSTHLLAVPDNYIFNKDVL